MTLRLNNFAQNPVDFMRSCGYAFERETGDESSCMRRITGHDYPRYHAYIKKEGAAMIINLHIDQKKPSYAGSRAHNGEYDGDLVEREISRIQDLAGQ
jgi:hypothetical protein